MIFRNESPEESLGYADTILLGVEVFESYIDVVAEYYDQSKLNIRFRQASLIKYPDDGPERVESAKVLKLNEGRRRLILRDDDNIVFFEIEYSHCESI
ncbi:hypothetical protein [Pleionea sediminis]|uniref:hypothetical protein n=1 Tax=Pleionea sediminis TaxID=2569479 RepID=UPI0011862464|nr:hypothetical protein [Pleionea sediminis]